MDLGTTEGLTALDQFLADRSYIEGYGPTQADMVVFKALKNIPAPGFSHLSRWYNHVKSFGDNPVCFPGQAKDLGDYLKCLGICASGSSSAGDSNQSAEQDKPKSAAQLKKEAKKQEKLAKFQAKQAKMGSKKADDGDGKNKENASQVRAYIYSFYYYIQYILI